jgi:hypothetical protein
LGDEGPLHDFHAESFRRCDAKNRLKSGINAHAIIAHARGGVLVVELVDVD